MTEILLHAILAKQRFNAGRYTIVGHGGVHVSADMSYASCLAQFGWLVASHSQILLLCSHIKHIIDLHCTLVSAEGALI